MRKTIAFALILLAFASTISAEEYGVFMEISMRNGSSYNKVNRAPRRIALEVVYDSDSSSVTVMGDESLRAEVFVYDDSGELQAYSAALNSILFISTQGHHRIHIEGDDWTAEGEFEI